MDVSILLYDGPKALTNKTGISLTLIFVEIVCNTMLYMIFQNCWEPVLIQQILIGYKVILENLFF